MSYTHQALILRIQGHFGTSTSILEKWSTGVRIMNLGPGETIPPPPYTSFLTAIAGAISTFHGSNATYVGSNCFLTRLTAARVGTDGKYSPDTQITSEYLYGSPVAGSGTATGPWSQSMVTSLRTAKPRGTGSNGRLYYPYGVSNVQGATGLIQAATMNGYLSAMKTMLDTINTQANAMQSGCRIVVASNGGKSGIPVSLPVTQIRADGRLDTQERRENDIVPVYYTSNLA